MKGATSGWSRRHNDGDNQHVAVSAARAAFCFSSRRRSRLPAIHQLEARGLNYIDTRSKASREI